MLSRTKVKELSNVEESTIKNDKEFDVTVTYKDGDEDVSVVVKAGEEVTVPTEVAEEVTTQIADAVAPEAEDAPEDTPEDAPEDAPEDTPAPNDEEDENDKDKALAKAQLKNAEYAVKERYASLLSAGKVIPAQETKILALAKLGQGVNLSTDSGKKLDLATVVLDILEAGNVKFSTEENGGSADNPDAPEDDAPEDSEDKKPSETLSEAELAGFKAVGADPAKMDELAEKDPVFREALKSLSAKYNKKGTK